METTSQWNMARILVKTPWQPLIQHKVSAWINGVEYTVHMAEETCYNLDRCKCWGRSFIGSLEEIIFDDSESEIGTQMAIEGVILETDPSEEDTLPSTDGGRNNNLGCSHCKTSRHAQDFCYDLNGFPENTANVPKFEKYKQTKEKNPS